MSYDREPVLAWLEEDNTQRSYFRLMPLITPTEDIREEAQKKWPDHGALRIVPDKNEQGFFKERMRSMGSFCMMDLTRFPVDATKIRSNKNYRPEKEESNQFILYSDAVQKLPPHTFFEVLDGSADAAAELAAKAATPIFIIREKDVFLGPVEKAAPAAPSPLGEMTATIFSIPCPDGTEHTFLCTDAIGRKEEAEPKHERVRMAEPAPKAEPQQAANVSQPEETVVAAEAPVQDEALPIGQSLNILDQTKSFDETLQNLNSRVGSKANLLNTAKKAVPPAQVAAEKQEFNGTPLTRVSGMRTSAVRPRDRVQEAVSAQNMPPAPPLPSGAELQHIVNPVENAYDALRAAWKLPNTRQQITDFFKSLPGAEECMNPANKLTALQKAMLARLDDIEADRLAALVQMSQARGDLEAFRQQTLEGLRKNSQQKISDFEQRTETARIDFESVREELDRLQQQRDALQQEISRLQSETLPETVAELITRAQWTVPTDGKAIVMTSRCGTEMDPDSMVDRVLQVLTAWNNTVERNTAAALLALLGAGCRRIGLACQTPAALFTILQNISDAMGWQSGLGVQTAPDERAVVHREASGSTPVILLTTLALRNTQNDCLTVRITRDETDYLRSPLYDIDPWPVLNVGSLPFAERLNTEDTSPIALTLPCSANDKTALEVLAPIMAKTLPISGNAAKEMCRFVSIAANLMDGGLASACDWAITLWLLPMIHARHLEEAVRPLLTEYPMTASKL